MSAAQLTLSNTKFEEAVSFFLNGDTPNGKKCLGEGYVYSGSQNMETKIAHNMWIIKGCPTVASETDKVYFARACFDGNATADEKARAINGALLMRGAVTESGLNSLRTAAPFALRTWRERSVTPHDQFSEGFERLARWVETNQTDLLIAGAITTVALAVILGLFSGRPPTAEELRALEELARLWGP